MVKLSSTQSSFAKPSEIPYQRKSQSGRIESSKQAQKAMRVGTTKVYSVVSTSCMSSQNYISISISASASAKYFSKLIGKINYQI